MFGNIFVGWIPDVELENVFHLSSAALGVKFDGHPVDARREGDGIIGHIGGLVRMFGLNPSVVRRRLELRREG